MRNLRVYTDASVIGGCEDPEFSAASLGLWRMFTAGIHTLVLSVHTLRELQGAPESVRRHITEVPESFRLVVPDSQEAFILADAYLARGIVGPGSHADALHIALATTARVDVLVSWNFRHIVNLNRIRLFNAVNVEMGYGTLEIRTPAEVLVYE